MYQVSDRKNIKKNQRKRLNEVLDKIVDDVTADDRKAAMEAFKMAKSTLSMYLNGRGTNNDTIADLIAFFRDRINQRDKRAGGKSIN